ncbi:MAG: hypothetical protein KBT50_05840 [Cycloclasticus sp.]|nr:hypothetical protein [Cycloclasticus sp.]
MAEDFTEQLQKNETKRSRAIRETGDNNKPYHFSVLGFVIWWGGGN